MGTIFPFLLFLVLFSPGWASVGMEGDPSPTPTPTPIRLGLEDGNRWAREHMDPPIRSSVRLPPQGEEYERLILDTAWVDARSVLFRGGGPSRRIEEPTGRLLWRMCREGRIYTAVVDTTVFLCARLFFEAHNLPGVWIPGPDGGGFFAASLPDGRRITMALPGDTLPWVELDRYGRDQVGFVTAIGTARPEYDARCVRKVDGRLTDLARMMPGPGADRALQALEDAPGAMREFLRSARFVQLETPGEADGEGRVRWEDPACIRLSWAGPGLVAWAMVGQIHRGNIRASAPFDPRQVFPTRDPLDLRRAGGYATPEPAFHPPAIPGDEASIVEAGVPVERQASRGGMLWAALPLIILLLVVFAIGLSVVVRTSQGGNGGDV